VSVRFRRGLVVGKFCPLHAGHEYVIEHALSACDEVLLISYTKPDFAGCDRATREGWLTRRFAQATVLVIDDAHLAQLCMEQGMGTSQTIPHNDAPDDIHRRFVAWLCLYILGQTVDAVFTSEVYGDGFAEVLSTEFHLRTPSAPRVQHVCVDGARGAVPISGTRVRLNPHENRAFLSPDVYTTFVERVCILGGESTGKSTLAHALAQHFDTVWAPEYGRELWEQKRGQLVLDDMLEIGLQQTQREAELARSAKRFLICDTSALTTLFYSLDMFGVADPELLRLTQRRYEHVLLCAPDFVFVQDGTRRDSAFRQRQHNWYVAELTARGTDYGVLSGGLDARLHQAATYLHRDRF
jgi:NadR type nicotinamide-nucleotide adenylyltransferase